MDDMVKDEVRIDFVRLIRIVLRKSIWIVLAMILIGAGAYQFLNSHNEPVYTSSGSIYVIDDKISEDIFDSLEQLEIGSKLVLDYQEMLTSRLVLEKVIEIRNLDISYVELKSKITVTNTEDTRILNITLQYDNASEAQDILNEIERVACDVLPKKMDTAVPNILQTASLPSVSYSYSVGKLTLVAAAAVGFMLVALFCALDIFTDKIRSEYDINRYFHIETIGNIPYKRGEKPTH